MKKPAEPAGQPPWRLVYYITEAGSCDTFDYLEALRETDYESYVFFLDKRYDAFNQHRERRGKPRA